MGVMNRIEAKQEWAPVKRDIEGDYEVWAARELFDTVETYEEAFRIMTQRVAKIMIQCEQCGTPLITRPDCSGSGEIWNDRRAINRFDPFAPCSRCRGMGKVCSPRSAYWPIIHVTPGN
jgi:DnaJ-class molecular chaperone